MNLATFRSSVQQRWFSLKPANPNSLADDAGAHGVRRVLLTGDTVGGVWTFVMELAEGLTRAGMEVLLATFGPQVSRSQRQQARLVRGLEWQHHHSKLEWMNDPGSDMKKARSWLLGLSAAFKPDLIHLNTLYHGDLPIKVPIVTTVHSCVLSWWDAVKASPLPSEWNDYRSHVEHSLRCATLITAPSSSALRELSKHYCLNNVDSLAIYNGRKGSTFNASKKEPLILCVGRLWDEAKNVSALATVAGDLIWPVYLAGSPDGPFNSAATFPRCHQLGELAAPELTDWYGRASIYSLPARYEPFGLSALEAALSECALVLGDIPSQREVWGDAATYVAPDDHLSLRTALDCLIKKPDHRRRMAQRARRRAAMFTQDRMVSGYVRAYLIAAIAHEELHRRHACAS